MRAIDRFVVFGGVDVLVEGVLLHAAFVGG